jgi:hypothetical protein
MDLLFVFFVGFIFFIALTAGNKKPFAKKADDQGFIGDFDNRTQDVEERNEEFFEGFHDDSSTDFNYNNDLMDYANQDNDVYYSDTSSNDTSSGEIPSDF